MSRHMSTTDTQQEVVPSMQVEPRRQEQPNISNPKPKQAAKTAKKVKYLLGSVQSISKYFSKEKAREP